VSSATGHGRQIGFDKSGSSTRLFRRAGLTGNIVLIWLQDMQLHVHMILGGVLASILGLMIFSIAALDNPFRGNVSVGPDAIVLIYETLLEQNGSDAGLGRVPSALP
jgi:hypothetical protein